MTCHPSIRSRSLTFVPTWCNPNSARFAACAARSSASPFAVPAPPSRPVFPPGTARFLTEPQPRYLLDAASTRLGCPQGSPARPNEGWSVTILPVRSTAFVPATDAGGQRRCCVCNKFPRSNHRVYAEQPRNTTFPLSCLIPRWFTRSNL